MQYQEENSRNKLSKYSDRPFQILGGVLNPDLDVNSVV